MTSYFCYTLYYKMTHISYVLSIQQIHSGFPEPPPGRLEDLTDPFGISWAALGRLEDSTDRRWCVPSCFLFHHLHVPNTISILLLLLYTLLGCLFGGRRIQVLFIRRNSAGQILLGGLFGGRGKQAILLGCLFGGHPGNSAGAVGLSLSSLGRLRVVWKIQ